MVITALHSADGLLRGDDRLAHGTNPLRHLALVVALMVGFGLIYGGVMGSYGGGRPLQMLYSAVKVPLLLSATFVLSLPSFFVLNTLLGLRDDFGRAIRALIATQAGLTIILASFAPFTALWYVSVADYDGAKMFNLLMFGVASITAQLMLRRFYQPLIARDRRHRLLMRIWLVIYAFVGVQMGWVLRPFIGNPNDPTRFFRTEAWGNAYLEVIDSLGRVLGL